ncbi:MAG: NAD(P)H-hydrate dehydratase [Alphaproteobacteria bacterium]|nr:NAD(P)H-hydrate dehydratase [Alphaproteobacteria bacterium]
MTGRWPGDASRHALLTVAEMQEADRRAVASGISEDVLMERAGAAVAKAAMKRLPSGRVVVLSGPGGNGGDGYVAARILADRGWPVRVCALRPDAMTGATRRMAELWTGETAAVTAACVSDADLVVDALFGAGLSRDLDPSLAAMFAGIRVPVIAVDMPSGIDGDTGWIRGGAVSAQATVTFCRRKPGHVLMPGRRLCGDVAIADIGIGDSIVAAISPGVVCNTPALWRDRWPWPSLDAHKHARGHLVVLGGSLESSGASRLAAAAGLRAGAGLVTCAMPRAALLAHAVHHTAVMNHAFAGSGDFAELMAAGHVHAGVLGPGAGTGSGTRDLVVAALAAGKPLVLDADALTAFRECRQDLFDRIHERCVLTPHTGEFRRLFHWTGDRLRDVAGAAAEAGCVVLLKGPDTTIADRHGRLAVNANGSPFLATAGSGDVLAGIIGGLLAQGTPPLDAAMMGCWLHAEAGGRCTPGLVAEDLADRMVPVLAELHD